MKKKIKAYVLLEVIIILMLISILLIYFYPNIIEVSRKIDYRKKYSELNYELLNFIEDNSMLSSLDDDYSINVKILNENSFLIDYEITGINKKYNIEIKYYVTKEK